MNTEPSAPSGQVDRVVMPGLINLVAWLTDYREQPWTVVLSYQDAANRTLAKMVEFGMIEGRHHPHTLSANPSVYRVDDQIFGRIDGIDHSLFDEA